MTVTLNTPPTLSGVASQTTVQGTAASLQLSGADPDGDALTYGAKGLPPGIAIAVSTGLICGHAVDGGELPGDGDRVRRHADGDAHVHVDRDGGRGRRGAGGWITTPTTATTFSTSAATLPWRHGQRQRGCHAGDLDQQPRRKRYCDRHDELECIGRSPERIECADCHGARRRGQHVDGYVDRHLQRGGTVQRCKITGHGLARRSPRRLWRLTAPPTTVGVSQVTWRNTGGDGFDGVKLDEVTLEPWRSDGVTAATRRMPTVTGRVTR